MLIICGQNYNNWIWKGEKKYYLQPLSVYD